MLGATTPPAVFSQSTGQCDHSISLQFSDDGFAESTQHPSGANHVEVVGGSFLSQPAGFEYRFSDQSPGSSADGRASVPILDAGALVVGDGKSNCSARESQATGLTLNQGGSLDHGYAIVLPGLLGSVFCDKNVAKSLRKSEFEGAVEIYDWTRKPVMIGLNLGGNRCQANSIATKIVDYQTRYPGRPVYLLGHSAGCKMAIMALEALPPMYQVERAFLLAPGLQTNYDLRPAMARTRLGLVAFTSFLDAPLPLPLTVMEGLLKGQLNLAAAVFGFSPPAGLGPRERESYDQMLVQKPFRLEMIFQGNLGGHAGATWPSFVGQQIAPMIKSGNFSTPEVRLADNLLETRTTPHESYSYSNWGTHDRTSHRR